MKLVTVLAGNTVLGTHYAADTNAAFSDNFADHLVSSGIAKAVPGAKFEGMSKTGTAVFSNVTIEVAPALPAGVYPGERRIDE